MENDIEKAVRTRRTTLAKKFMKKYLSTNPSLEARIRCADWLRRLGLYQRGYLLIAPTEWSLQTADTASPEGIHRLWCARFLNLLGSTHFAVKALETIRCSSVDSHRIAGTIHLSAYQHEQAYQHYKIAASMNSKPLSYQAKLGLIGLSDSLSELGKFKEAIQNLNSVEPTSEETLLKGITLQAKGEYLAKQGDFNSAEKTLKEALLFYPEGDSPDHGFLYKWIGFVEAKQGRISSAKIWFNKAISSLKKPDIRAEAWLEIYYLMHQVHLLPKDQIQYLIHYPELPLWFVKRSRDTVTQIKASKKKSTHFWISIRRQEFKYRKTQTLGIPKDIHLLHLLKASGPHGCHFSRLKSALWPEELGSFLQLEARLLQLFHRLKKKYKIKVTIAEQIASLSNKTLEQIDLELDSTDSLPTFFATRLHFTSADFGGFYGLKKTQSSVYLKNLMEKNLIEKIKGSKSGYLIKRSTAV